MIAKIDGSITKELQHDPEIIRRVLSRLANRVTSDYLPLRGELIEFLNQCGLDSTSYEISIWSNSMVNFLNSYCDDIQRPYLIERLTNLILDKIVVLTENDMLNTAEMLLSEVKDEVLLFIPGSQLNHHAFFLQRPDNSNVHMAELTMRLAKQRGITVKVLTEWDMSEETDSVSIIDDAMYSGSQIPALLNLLSQYAGRDIDVKVFLAGATYGSIKNIMKSYPNVQIHSTVRIPSFNDIYEANPLLGSLFVIDKLCGAYGFSRGNAEQFLEAYYSYMHLVGLARTVYKIPDDKSIPKWLINYFPLVDSYPKTVPSLCSKI